MNVLLIKRYLVFILGVLINSFGISFITKASLGTSPITSVPYVFSLRFAPTLGECSFVLNMLFIFLQLLLLRRDFQKIQLLQIAVNFVFSWFIDVSMLLLASFAPVSYAAKLVSLAAGCAILAFGISLEVYANVLMIPGEGAVYAIYNVMNKEFGVVKAGFDITLMLTAVTLSLLFFRGLNGIGEGTVISAFIVGMIVRLYNKRLGFIGSYLNPQRQ
ncbi:MAG: DUF6198 family protein [Cloacibacillus porcorum]|nr:DUF6198 family protein [Cloacibacillus porcorum]